MKRLHVSLLAILVIAAGLAVVFPTPMPTQKTPTGNQEPAANLSTSYPEHPKTLEDCENTSKRNFCIDDLAEITNNISLCHEIKDADIEVFCRARILLDEALCNTIRDAGLTEACLESIKMKKEWNRG